MASIAQNCASGTIPGAEIVCVIGTVASSPAIERARSLGLAIRILSAKSEDFDNKLASALADLTPDLVCLAGFMRKLPKAILERYENRIINIHPALLPSFGGKGMYGHHVHEAVIAHGCKVTGCSVHFVDEGYDTGPIIVQKCVPVYDTDDPEALGARVLTAEHTAYSEAIALIAQGRVGRTGRVVKINPADT